MYKLTALAITTTLLIRDSTQYVNAIKLMKESKEQLSPDVEKAITDSVHQLVKDKKKVKAIEAKIGEDHAIEKIMKD